MIVVDASLMVAALTDDGEQGKQAYAALTSDSHWAAPAHLPVEVTSAVRGRWLARKISDERAGHVAATLPRLTVDYTSGGDIAERVWELRHNYTPYDAAYIALAELRGCTLLTLDRKLANTGSHHATVHVVGD
ncbi:MAG: PIN domain-containing protein [Actinophytocola sp.]|nr:PIN domain-containing protein [Actinophytocola sp.]